MFVPRGLRPWLIDVFEKLCTFRNWLEKQWPGDGHSRSTGLRRYARLSLEPLGERIVPAGTIFLWTGNGNNKRHFQRGQLGSANWHPLSWHPVMGDILVFNGTLGQNSNKEADFDANSPTSLEQLIINPQYTGTVDVQHNLQTGILVVDSGVLTIDAGMMLSA